MSAAAAVPNYITEPREVWEARIIRLADAEYDRKKARHALAAYKDRAEKAEQLLDGLSNALNLDEATIERLAELKPKVLEEVRAELMRAIERQEEDGRAPACLNCGSPRADWTGTAWRCQDCGAAGQAKAEDVAA